jgi:hypothetical protein
VVSRLLPLDRGVAECRFDSEPLPHHTNGVYYPTHAADAASQGGTDHPPGGWRGGRPPAGGRGHSHKGGIAFGTVFALWLFLIYFYISLWFTVDMDDIYCILRTYEKGIISRGGDQLRVGCEAHNNNKPTTFSFFSENSLDTSF